MQASFAPSRYRYLDHHSVLAFGWHVGSCSSTLATPCHRNLEHHSVLAFGMARWPLQYQQVLACAGRLLQAQGFAFVATCCPSSTLCALVHSRFWPCHYLLLLHSYRVFRCSSAFSASSDRTPSHPRACFHKLLASAGLLLAKCRFSTPNGTGSFV